MKYTNEKAIRCVEWLDEYCCNQEKYFTETETVCPKCPFYHEGGGEKSCAIFCGCWTPDASLFEHKKSEKKIVPFDFSLEEDKNTIKGRWLKRKEGGDEFLVIGFSMACAMFAEDVVLNWGKGTSRSFGDGKELLDQFVFADTGLPVGKEVKE